jgi:hypothetical protein
MSAFVLPRPNSYVGITTVDGTFALEKLPAGTWEFQFWHERCGYLRALPEWTRGRVSLTISADETLDLGDILVSPELFHDRDREAAHESTPRQRPGGLDRARSSAP